LRILPNALGGARRLPWISPGAASLAAKLQAVRIDEVSRRYLASALLIRGDRIVVFFAHSQEYKPTHRCCGSVASKYGPRSTQ
jgi:hypothetical protein